MPGPHQRHTLSGSVHGLDCLFHHLDLQGSDLLSEDSSGPFLTPVPTRPKMRSKGLGSHKVASWQAGSPAPPCLWGAHCSSSHLQLSV